MPNAIDLILFGVLPYLAFSLFFVETIRRYIQQKYSYTSLSTQFLENKKHFWVLMSFHYGIIGTLLGHVIAFAIPRQVLWWNSYPARLYVLEATALTFGLLALVGIVGVIWRRMSDKRLAAVSNRMDGVVYTLLFLMIATGVDVAMTQGWGTSWFAGMVTPYLWSLVRFQPEISLISPMHWIVKLHMTLAFLLIAVFPFTKLVHVLVIPNQFLFRKPQVVRWYGVRKETQRV